MNTTKLTASTVAALLFATAAMAQWEHHYGAYPSMDIGIAVRGYGPSRDADWTGGAGVDAHLRMWQNDECGVALVAGLQKWEAVSEYSESDDGFSAVATDISGNTTLIPIGVSLFYRGAVSDQVRILLEGGLRYAFTESDVIVDAAYVDDESERFRSDEIQVENTFLAVFGIDLELELAPHFAVTGGLGYQWDILQPNETLFGADLGSTSFSAVTVRLGVGLCF